MSEKHKVLLVMGVILIVLLGLLIFTVVVYRRALANTQSQVKECLVLLSERENQVGECMRKTKMIQLSTRYRMCLELLEEHPMPYPGGVSDPCYSCIEHTRDLGALSVEGCRSFVECVDKHCGGSYAND